MRKKIIIALVVILSAILLRATYSTIIKVITGIKMKEMATPTVTVDTVKGKSVIRQFEAPARVVSKYKVDVTARINGYLTKSYFKEGDYVKAGQILFEIEPEEFSLGVQKAKANLDNVNAQLKYYEKQLKRSEELVKLDYIAKADYDNILAQRDTYKAQVALAQSTYSDTMRTYGYTHVKAPVDGRIGLITVTVGNYVTANSGPLTTINSVEPMYVTFPLNSKDFVELIRIDKTANVSRKVDYIFNTGVKYELAGTQDFHDNKVDETTGTIMMRATFKNPKSELIHGDFGKIIIYSNEKDNTPVVPLDAIMENQESKFVYIMDEKNIPKLSYIKMAGQEGNYGFISEGVSIGDTIITTGLQKVTPGQPVKITKSETKDPKNSVKSVKKPSLASKIKTKLLKGNN